MNNQTHEIKTVGVIISTYNNPRWLEKTLWSYESQTRPADEIIIADDGSGQETKELIRKYSDKLPIKHIWHEDNGFRKTEILNKAVAAATADYLIFTDQDCVARYDFVSVHLANAQAGYFLSGGCLRLPMGISICLTAADISSRRAFLANWLLSQGLQRSLKNLKLTVNSRLASFLNCVTPTAASWNGGNSSCFRQDALEVNGFNERMSYGGEDREFGERLMLAGIKGRQIRYSAICLHLDHKRPYKNELVIAKNHQIRKITRQRKVVKTPFGIEKLTEGASYYDQAFES